MDTSMMCPSLPRAKRNRFIVHEGLFVLGYIEQEILREHWTTGTPKPTRLIVGEDFPTVLPNRYHPFADWRATDGRGRKSVMKGWLGEAGFALDLGLIADCRNNRHVKARIVKATKVIAVKYAGEVDFMPSI
jgi:hypothetical protein